MHNQNTLKFQGPQNTFGCTFFRQNYPASKLAEYYTLQQIVLNILKKPAQIKAPKEILTKFSYKKEISKPKKIL